MQQLNSIQLKNDSIHASIINKTISTTKEFLLFRLECKKQLCVQEQQISRHHISADDSIENRPRVINSLEESFRFQLPILTPPSATPLPKSKLKSSSISAHVAP